MKYCGWNAWKNALKNLLKNQQVCLHYILLCRHTCVLLCYWHSCVFDLMRCIRNRNVRKTKGSQFEMYVLFSNTEKCLYPTRQSNYWTFQIIQYTLLHHCCSCTSYTMFSLYYLRLAGRWRSATITRRMFWLSMCAMCKKFKSNLGKCTGINIIRIMVKLNLQTNKNLGTLSCKNVSYCCQIGLPFNLKKQWGSTIGIA